MNANLEQAEALRNVRSTSPISTTQHTNNTEKPSDQQLMPISRCLSRGCVTAASKIIEYLDESVDACENFYEFACGNYIKNAIIPKGMRL